MRRADPLASLADTGRALAAASDLRSSLEHALEKLETARGIVRGAVFLREGRDIGVAAALGISTEGLRARYQPGEGIVGRVVQSGRQVVVPSTRKEPQLLDRAFQRKRSGAGEASFV